MENIPHENYYNTCEKCHPWKLQWVTQQPHNTQTNVWLVQFHTSKNAINYLTIRQTRTSTTPPPQPLPRIPWPLKFYVMVLSQGIHLSVCDPPPNIAYINFNWILPYCKLATTQMLQTISLSPFNKELKCTKKGQCWIVHYPLLRTQALTSCSSQ